MNTVSKYHPLKHYTWGKDCDGWNLVDSETLSVKQERMPAYTAEALHYHKRAQQFFFILKGEALFEIEGERRTVRKGEGIGIAPGQKHRIINGTEETLEFILCSEPNTANDRYNIEDETH